MIATSQIHKVCVYKNEENGFKKRAIAALPNEYIELMWGWVENNVAYVAAFVPIHHKATKAGAWWDDFEVDIQKAETENAGIFLLGSIHTHPERSTTELSSFDIKELQKRGELITGICAIEYKPTKNRLIYKCRFSYRPGLLPFEVEYL
jgi:proteasome lid subunit RPN8/RPN11